jgi:hypothetical protein
MASICTIHGNPGSPLEFSRSSIPKRITIPYGRIFIAATALMEDNKEMRNTYPICTFPFWQLGPPRPLEVCEPVSENLLFRWYGNGARTTELGGSIGLYHESLCLFGQSMSSFLLCQLGFFFKDDFTSFLRDICLSPLVVLNNLVVSDRYGPIVRAF